MMKNKIVYIIMLVLLITNFILLYFLQSGLEGYAQNLVNVECGSSGIMQNTIVQHPWLPGRDYKERIISNYTCTITCVPFAQ